MPEPQEGTETPPCPHEVYSLAGKTDMKQTNVNEYLYYDVKSCIRIDKNRALWERKKGDLAPMK